MTTRHPEPDAYFVGLPIGPLGGHVPGTSQNVTAEQVMGRREADRVVINQPPEMGYVCPICETSNGVESLLWSEYNAFLWCSHCNVDLPSVLCMPAREDETRREHLARLTDLYLTTVRQAADRRRESN